MGFIYEGGGKEKLFVQGYNLEVHFATRKLFYVMVVSQPLTITRMQFVSEMSAVAIIYIHTRF